MPKRTGPRKGVSPAADPSQRIIDAALALAAVRPWHEVALTDIANAAGMPLGELIRHFDSKQAIFAAYMSAVDAEVLGTAASGDSVREKLFDVMMRRFDALNAHKAALKSILGSAARDPLATLCAGPRFLRSMAMLAESAGVKTWGPLGLLRVKGVAGVYLLAVWTWLADESSDHSKTMAALDRALNRAEAVARSFSNFPTRQAG